ncbi:MAG: hypothetical protein CTY23_03225 [Methylomonas sp.]|nr:MAG: hypothetical protein CTY23_03225 [Methylomonas sp.]
MRAGETIIMKATLNRLTGSHDLCGNPYRTSTQPEASSPICLPARKRGNENKITRHALMALALVTTGAIAEDQRPPRCIRIDGEKWLEYGEVDIYDKHDGMVHSKTVYRRHDDCKTNTKPEVDAPPEHPQSSESAPR